MGGKQTYGLYGAKVLLIIIFASFQHTIIAQGELPDIPDIIRVTVDHSDGGHLIQWEPSSDPDIANYRIYIRNDLVFQLLVTAPPDTYEYKYLGAGIRNPAFAVTALDSSGNESLFEQNVHRAVGTSVQFDPCIPANVISWEPYEGWEGNISAYEIYGRSEGGTFDMLGFVSPSSLTFTDESISTGNNYLYFVTAVNINGTTSLSAIGAISSNYPAPPSFISLDYVTVIGPSQVEISISTDLSGEINDFRIMKRSNPGTPFIEVMTITDATQSTLVVTDDIPTSAESFEYMVQSLYTPPSCSEPIILSQSNPGNNVLLNYEVTDQTISLNWTPYEAFESGLSGYTIQRSGVDGEFFDIQTVGSGTTSWQETIESVINGYQTGELRYKVVAHESMAGSGESHSNIVSVHVVTNLQVPNAFTPGSNDMNFEFKPRFDFAPRDYLMIVLDRGGRKLFETSDPGEGWDGRFRQGEFVTEGVYVYFIQYTDYTGLFRTYTGNVTVLYP